MSIADAMASNGMKELGYEYINLDGELNSRHITCPVRCDVLL